MARHPLRSLRRPAYRRRVPRARPLRRDRQIVRVIGILKILLDGGRPRVPDLAARFKTRRETIYRDLRVLQEVGYPLGGDDERGGYGGRPRLLLPARQTAPPITLTKPETAALVWAVRQTEAHQPFKAALATAFDKLQALSGRGGHFALALDGAMGGWDRGVKDYHTFATTILRVVEAIVSHRRCRMVYQSPQRPRPTTYEVDPYRLLWVHGGLYCLGHVQAYGELRTFAVDRIREIDVTEQPFTVDPGFDPKRYETEAFGVSWEHPMTVVVRFSRDQAPYVRERQWHPTQTLRELRDGRVELTFRAGGMFEIARWILGWGDAAEVVRPPALRREIVSLLKSAATIYRSRLPRVTASV
jgi:predicted DNA-binding transcriptional regulator YafY